MKLLLYTATLAIATAILWRLEIVSNLFRTMTSTGATPSPVVVIGSGLAGLTSTYTLLQKRVPVILLEKTDKFGGNSAKASSGINGVLTPTQVKLGIDDTPELFLKDTAKSSGALGNEKLQKALVDDSKAAITWLQEEIGAGLTIVNRLGGHSKSRTHRSEGIPPGFEIISKLQKKVQALDGLDVRLQAKFTGLDIQDKKVKGVQYVDLATGVEKSIDAQKVIVATGGFGFSKELLKKYKPEFVSLPTTNGNQTLGEGQVLLEEAGAQLTDMEQVQIHPTGFIKQDDRDSNWKFLAAESLRGVGGVLLNEKLDRFVNELTTRDKVSAAIREQEGQKAYLVLNEAMYNEFKFQIDFYMKMRLIEKVSLAEKFGDKADHALEVLTEYTLKDCPFSREHRAHLFEGLTKDTELFIGEVTPVVHFTMGGVKIDDNGRVLNTDGDVIQGLYAVGEVSGGVHGENRLAGNSLLECVVFGRRAANDVSKGLEELLGKLSL